MNGKRLAVSICAFMTVSLAAVWWSQLASAQTTLPPLADEKSCCKQDNCGGKVLVGLFGDEPTDGCSISFWGNCTGTCYRCNGSVTKYTCYYINDEEKKCQGISQNPYYSCGIKVAHPCVNNGGGGVNNCCPPPAWQATPTTDPCNPPECELTGDSSACP